MVTASMYRVLSSRKAVLIVGGCEQSCQRGSSITVQAGLEVFSRKDVPIVVGYEQSCQSGSSITI